MLYGAENASEHLFITRKRNRQSVVPLFVFIVFGMNFSVHDLHVLLQKILVFYKWLLSGISICFLLCNDQRKEYNLTSLKRLKVSRDYQTSDFDDGFLQSFYVKPTFRRKILFVFLWCYHLFLVEILIASGFRSNGIKKDRWCVWHRLFFYFCKTTLLEK